MVLHLPPMPGPNTWCTSIITAHSELRCSLGIQAQHAELISFLLVVEPCYLRNLVQPWRSLTVKPHGKHFLISWKPCRVCWEKKPVKGISQVLSKRVQINRQAWCSQDEKGQRKDRSQNWWLEQRRYQILGTEVRLKVWPLLDYWGINLNIF